MEKCPACEREFKRLEDFPRIYIAGFERLEIPTIIESHPYKLLVEEEVKREKGLLNEPLPQEILELFREGEDVIVHEGFVYTKRPSKKYDFYTAARNMASVVREAVANQKVQSSLSTLENFVGKEVATKDLSSLLDFKVAAGRYNDFSLSFFEEEQEPLRVCKVSLTGGWSGATIRAASVSCDLAKLKYEGRINQ